MKLTERSSWYVEEYSLKCEIVTGNGDVIATVHSGCCDTPEEMKAIAMLIAEAPGMYAMLQELNDKLNETFGKLLKEINVLQKGAAQ